MDGLKVPFLEELYDFRFPPALGECQSLSLFSRSKEAYLNNYMPRKTINSNLGGLGRSIIEIERKIARQCIHIAFTLLYLGLLFRPAGFSDEVDGELVRACTTDEVGEVCES